MIGLISRIRTALKDGWHESATHFGAVYVGSYGIKGSKVLGSLKHQFEISRRPPKAVILLRDQVEIASTGQFKPDGGGWTFCIDTDQDFTADDILKERLEVYGVDRLGGRSKLRVEGAMQLTYIRAAYGTPSELEIAVDFSHLGNSNAYVREGWYGAEQQHRWTAGKFSTIELPLMVPGSQYTLEIVAWPFVIRDAIESQELSISVNSSHIERFYVRSGHNYLESFIPRHLAQSHSITIRFDHPDAARPCDFNAKGGDRTLAIAFQAMHLRRLIGGADDVANSETG
jgi:hypothetical protein